MWCAPPPLPLTPAESISKSQILLWFVMKWIAKSTNANSWAFFLFLHLRGHVGHSEKNAAKRYCRPECCAQRVCVGLPNWNWITSGNPLHYFVQFSIHYNLSATEGFNVSRSTIKQTYKWIPGLSKTNTLVLSIHRLPRDASREDWNEGIGILGTTI